MLERSGRPLLIEINANPFLGTQNEWHAALVARAADDFVGLALEESAPDVATELLVGGAAPEVDGVEVATWRGSGWVQLLGEAKGFPPPLYTTRQGARGPCSRAPPPPPPRRRLAPPPPPPPPPPLRPQ